MVKFIKNFGLGLVYFLALPLLLIAVVGYMVTGIGWWLFYVGKGLVRFFRGESFFAEMPEDAEVRRIKAKVAESTANSNPAPAPAPSPTYTTNTTDSSQTYHVTNNFFGTPPVTPGNSGMQNPAIGTATQQSPDYIDVNAKAIDLTAQENPVYAELPNNTPVQQISGPAVPLIESNDDQFSDLQEIDLSLDEEEFK